jgi:hypothetical protein
MNEGFAQLYPSPGDGAVQAGRLRATGERLDAAARA